MSITDIIGKGKIFEPPFKCYQPVGNPEKTYVWDKNLNCLLEVRGARRLQGAMNYQADAKGVQECQQELGTYIANILNKDVCADPCPKWHRTKINDNKYDLPDKTGRYLVVPAACPDDVMEGVFLCYSNCWLIVGCYCGNDEVIAWTEKPQPPKFD